MNILYLIHTYNEYDFTSQVVKSIRRHDSKSSIVVINDGGAIENLEELCESTFSVFINGERLKKLGTGAAWIRRMLEAGLEKNPDYIVKLDSDAFMWRNPVIQNPMNFFGSKIGEYSIQGGIKGYSKDYANKILNLENLENIADSCVIEASGQWGEDRTTAKIAEILGQKAEPWHDVKSVFGENGENYRMDRGRYSITHPVSLFDVEDISASKNDIWSMARRAGGELATWGLDGFRISKSHKNRIGICRKCEFFKNQVCTKCGCYMNAKTKLATSKCPIGKW